MSAPRCVVIRATETYTGLQGLTYRRGITHDTAGANAVCMTVLTLPPGARAKAHLHHEIETAIYVIEGEAETYAGDELGQHMVTRAGDYLYIPPDVPHMVMNRSEAPCRAVVVHGAPDDQQRIVLRPDLEGLVP